MKTDFLFLYRWTFFKTILRFTGVLLGMTALSNQGALAETETVCAKVKLQVEQELTLERQAFNAFMRINNGIDQIALSNVAISVHFYDEAGEEVGASSDPDDTNAVFFIRIDQLKNITSIEDGVVQPQTSAEIHWLIIPALGAAGFHEFGTMYNVGATLEYTLLDKQEVVNVLPDTISVKPMPELNLDYFLPHDVFGDDPMTTFEETPIPFILGLRVKNAGYGPVHQLQIESAQPKITENELGLLIAFQLLGTEIDSIPSSASLNASIGSIEPGAATMVAWKMTASLTGEFTEFNASYTHDDELGGKLTSLIQGLQTHTLVKDVIADLPDRDSIVDFLALDTDYTLYESNGQNLSVTNLSDQAELTLQESTSIKEVYQITTPAFNGAGYVQVDFRQFDGVQVLSVIRSDGKKLLPENTWLTKHRQAATLPWQHEFCLFDMNGGGSYVLTVDITEAQSNQQPQAVIAAAPLSGDLPLIVSFDGSDSSDSDGNIVSYEWDFGDGTDPVLTNEILHMYTQPGDYTAFLTVMDDDEAVDLTSVAIHVDDPATNPPPPSGITWEVGVANLVDNQQWTTVNLHSNYTDAVVICTPNYTGDNPPQVVRVRDVANQSFQLKMDRADGSSSATPGVAVHYLVVEAGVYSNESHGIDMEAVKFLSTVTDRKKSFIGESRTYAQEYTQPVVLGQVMSYSNDAFSVFWCRGSSAVAPPTPTTLHVGKHVGADAADRAPEVLGYVVLDAATGTVSGVSFMAGLGADTVQGMDNAPPYTYAIADATNACCAVASQAAMDGSDGGWCVLYDTRPASNEVLRLVVDEDKLDDAERSHTTEQVGWLVFQDHEDPGSPSGLMADAPTGARVDVSWTPATDNIGIAHYRVYRDGQFIGASEIAAFSDTTVASAMTYSYTVAAVDYADRVSALSAPVEVTTPQVDLVWEYGQVAVDDQGWVQVTLQHSYNDQVVVCTPASDETTPPMVTRVRNASGNSFEVKLQRVDGLTDPLTQRDVRYVVAEAGRYEQAMHGIRMEALKYTSTITDDNNSWLGESRPYLQTYTQPVVLGQVMSHNDARFSCFWSCGAVRTDPPGTTELCVGKHVGEDPVTAHTNEIVGYIVIEAGEGEVAGLAYAAGLGAATVKGLGDAPPYAYSVSTIDDVANGVICMAGMDGGNGGWAVFYGNDPLDQGQVQLAVDEDQLADPERAHIGEQIAWLVFKDREPPTVPTGLQVDAFDAIQVALSWMPSTDNVGVREYEVYRDSTLIGSTTESTYLDDTVAPATSYSYMIAALDHADNCSAQSDPVVVTTPASPLVWEYGVTQVDNLNWTAVPLQQSYANMVVICTPVYDNSHAPAVIRVRNASEGSFEALVHRVDGSMDALPAIDMHYLVVEAGVYTEVGHGVRMEAVTYTSTYTAQNNDWTAEPRDYLQTYTQPVVLGQVMSAADARFSCFWSRGTSAGNPPDATVLHVGKNVAEDPAATRTNETIGYIVIEAGQGQAAGVDYSAALGANTVKGMGNAPPFMYQDITLTDAESAVACISGMNGNNGGWAVLYSPDPLNGDQLQLAIDEDTLQDTERSHITEQVSWIAFKAAGAGGRRNRSAMLLDRSTRFGFVQWYRFEDAGVYQATQTLLTLTNAAGDVAGTVLTDAGAYHAFLRRKGMDAMDLGTLGGRHSYAFALNDTGEVAGSAQNQKGIYRAFVYRDGRMTELGALSQGWSVALGLNNAGQAAGGAADLEAQEQPVFFDQGAVRVLTVPSSGMGRALDVNDHGISVGWVLNDEERICAVLWTTTGEMIDLNTRVIDQPDWMLNQAQTIDEHGIIEGIGTVEEVVRRFRLIPMDDVNKE